jgi:hypothetical protein
VLVLKSLRKREVMRFSELKKAFQSVNERWHNCFHVRAGKLGSYATIWRESNFPTHADKQRTIDEIGIMGG